MEDIAIEINNVSKVYKLYDKPIDRLKETISLTKKSYHKDFYALNSINLKIKKGETVGIIGKNGAGKSTLLKIITGVLTPTSGDIKVYGRISSLLELGAGLNPEYTGMENIYLNGTVMGMTKEEVDERLQDVLDFADIGDFINQPVKTYSSGMYVRLAFSVAINVNPDILIVDEALAVGDARFQAKCYQKLEVLKDHGVTILFVSHDAEIREYKRRQMIEAGKRVGLQFETPEFNWCSCTDFHNRPNYIARLFRETPPTAVFARGDNPLYEFCERVRVFFPNLPVLDKVGAYNTVWSNQPGQTFPSWNWDWEMFWDQVFSHKIGIEYYRPSLELKY